MARPLHSVASTEYLFLVLIGFFLGIFSAVVVIGLGQFFKLAKIDRTQSSIHSMERSGEQEPHFRSLFSLNDAHSSFVLAPGNPVPRLSDILLKLQVKKSTA